MRVTDYRGVPVCSAARPAVSKSSHRMVPRQQFFCLLVAALLHCAEAQAQPTPRAAAPAVVCTTDYKPVCGTSPTNRARTTYSNQCVATRSGATSVQQGACPKAPPPAALGCTKEYNPVCGTSPTNRARTTYSNQCVATRSGATSVQRGACPKAPPSRRPPPS